MIRWDGVSYCIEPDCHEPATHERPNGVADDTVVYELVCETHDTPSPLGGSVQ